MASDHAVQLGCGECGLECLQRLPRFISGILTLFRKANFCTRISMYIPLRADYLIQGQSRLSGGDVATARAAGLTRRV